jgi:uncharacterized membrane protein YgcG
MRTLGVVGALVAVAAAVFGGAQAAWADPGEAVTAFDAVVAVDGAGDLQVTETIGYRFAGTAHHGLLRELHSSRVTAVQVETPTGVPASTSVTVSGGYTTIRVGDPARTVSGTQTYVLHYAVGRVVDGDVLRWDFVGDGWQVPVQRATVRVTGPRPAETRRCAAAGCTVTASGATAVFAAGPLAPGNGVPVTLDYPAGTIGGMTPGLAFLGWLQLAVVLGVLGGLGWVVARLLRSPQTARSGAHRAVAAVPVVAAGNGRTGTPAAWGAAPSSPPPSAPAATSNDAPHAVPPAASPAARHAGPPASPVVPLAETGLPAPPPDVSPGLLGIVDGGGKGTDAVTATLLDLAVRGYFRVEEQAGRRRPRGWTLVATAPTTPDRPAPHEEALLHSVFAGRPTTTITTVCQRRTRALDAAHKALVAEAVERGWVVKNVVATSGKAVGMAIFFLGFVAAIANFAGFPRSFPFFFLCFGASFVGVLVTALSALVRPVRRTGAGDAVLAELAPYRAALGGAGLERVPADRAAEVFSRSLPYAAALGLEYPWTRRFADLFALVPRDAASWYRPAEPGATALGAVTANVNGFVTAAGVRPSNSTSTGFASSGSSGSSAASYSGGDGGGGGSSGGGGSW